MQHSEELNKMIKDNPVVEWEEGSKIPKTDSRVAVIRILSKWALTVNTTNKWVDSNNLVTMVKCTDLCQECRHLHHT